MYVMLFYDEIYPVRNEYVLLDTDKKISELENFTIDYIEEHTQLISPIRYGIVPTWNNWHTMRSELPYWYVDHNFKQKDNVDAIINFTFYQPPIIDDGGDRYYLVLLRKNYGSPCFWNMFLYKTNQDVVLLAMDKCKELYDFKVNSYNRQTKTFFDKDNKPVNFIKFNLIPIKI